MSIEERVINIIKENLNKDIDIALETDLIKDLEIDSFDKIMIVSGIEEEFSITVDVDDFSKFEKVSQIVESLKKLKIK